MPLILLTGAGFSRNWGGWLANEAFEFLLGRPELNARIRNCLWKHDGRFEDAFQEMRDATFRTDDAIAQEDFRALNSMILDMFETMKLGFRSTPLETHQVASAMRTDTFLDAFDFIFTLNQDTLLEQHFIYQPPQPAFRFSSRTLPGLKPPAPIVEHGNQLHKAEIRIPLADSFSFDEKAQPYIKLHGSSNWRFGVGHLLIVGGNKSSDIDGIPLLRWYHQLFRDTITAPDTRIMVIGYSFGDEHINEHIEAAARAGNKLFIVDLAGVDVIAGNPKTARRNRMFNNLRDAVVGASRRPLRNTLHADPVELKKLIDFLDLKIQYRYDSA